MGYYQSINNYDLLIKADKIKSLVKDASEIKDLDVKCEKQSKWYCESIEINTWLLLVNSDTGNIDTIEYKGEKAWPTDKIVMDIIAKYSNDNDFIEMVGESGDLWQWQFIKGKCYTVLAKITWPEPKLPEPKFDFVKGAWVRIE